MEKNYYTLISFLALGFIGAFSCPGGNSEVQDVEDDFNFYRDIDDDTKTWLDDLNSKWRVQGASREVKYHIYDYLDISPNPYVSALKILGNTCHTYDENSNASLALTVIDNFREWLNIQYDPSSKYLNTTTKLAAFRLAQRQYYEPLGEKIAQVFEFKVEPTIFIPSIQSLICDEKYAQGGRRAIFMELESSLPDPENLLLSLVVQNKIAVIVDFLRGKQALQKKFLIYMDRLLDTPNVSQTFQQFVQGNRKSNRHNSPIEFGDVKYNLYRLAQKYGLSERECPNIYQCRREKMLRYFIREYLEQHDFRGEVWRDLVKKLVGSYVKLELLLVEELKNAGEFNEGLYWAEYYDVPIHKWEGESSTWTIFRDLFKARVIDKPGIAKVDKMRYLRASVSGAAAELIENLPVSADSFDSAWALLASRFENRRPLDSSQLEELTKVRVAPSPSVKSLKALQKTMADALDAFDALGTPVAHRNQYLAHIVSQQLDPSTREAWRVVLKNSNEYPSLDHLKRFLAEQVRALEQPESSSVRPSSTRGSREPYPCDVCLRDHYVVRCPTFNAFTLPSRLNFLNYLQLCHNCLGRHLIDECRLMKLCKICRQRHHTMLHPGSAQP